MVDDKDCKVLIEGAAKGSVSPQRKSSPNKQDPNDEVMMFQNVALSDFEDQKQV
jgi:hypothetical protein